MTSVCTSRSTEILCVPHQSVLGHVYPATKTFLLVICCPEDGQLTLEGCVVVVTVNPRRSSNTNGFNYHYVLQCSNQILERNAAEPLIAIRPTAPAKFCACQKNTSASQLH